MRGVNDILPPAAAECSFYRHVISTISRSEIVEMTCLSKEHSAQSAVKSHFTALRAKFKFETDVFIMILRSKIMINTSVSKEYSAVEGGKNLFTHSPKNILRGEAAPLPENIHKTTHINILLCVILPIFEMFLTKVQTIFYAFFVHIFSIECFF